jgi:preprotein translocase subunit SecB
MTQPEQQQAPALNIEKVYIKDMSYEAPNTPQVFMEQRVPEVAVQLNIAHNAVDQKAGLYEVVLSVTVTAKFQDKNVFLVEVLQAGLFRVVGIPADDLSMVLEIGCPNILLPFAREAINDLVGKGGFPQLLINPVNFEGLFQQKQAATAQTSH